MLAALFPKFGVWWLAWVALVPLILTARAVRPRAAAGYGFLAGLLFFAVLLEWIRIFDTVGWVLLALVQASFIALFAWLTSTLAPSPRGWRGVLVPAAAWTALEWVRSLTRAGFTWGDLAYALHGQLPLVQVVSLIGPFGLSFLLALANCAVAALLSAMVREKAAEATNSCARDRLVRAAAARVGVVVAVLLAAWGWGAHRLAGRPPAGPSIRVAALQGSIGGEGEREGWSMENVRFTAATYLRLTEQAAAQGAKLVLWPESALPCRLLDPVDPGARELREQIAATARRLQVEVILGTASGAGEREHFNSALLFGADGQVRGRYDKVHLVPYGEYTPWRQSLAFLYRHFPIIEDDCRPGRGFFPLKTDVGPVGVAICFESAFPRIARALRNHGAQALAVITNDAWFGQRSATWQHYDMAGFRAVETGSYVMRSATTGFSAILDPYGREYGRTRLFARGMVVGDIRLARTPTLYLLLGDAVGWGSALIVLGMLALIPLAPPRSECLPCAVPESGD